MGRGNQLGIERFPSCPECKTFFDQSGMSETPDTSQGRPDTHVTARKDWPALINELYGAVVAGCHFAIGIAAIQEGWIRSTVQLRLNNHFPSPEAISFIRGNFKKSHLESLFTSQEGLVRDEHHDLYKVTGDKMGLPKNSLVYHLENPDGKSMRALLLFGGERLENQMEQRLRTAGLVLGGELGARGRLKPEDREQLIAELRKLNEKRLFDYELSHLAAIVNGLEESKEDLPKELKLLYRAASDYLFQKRTQK